MNTGAPPRFAGTPSTSDPAVGVGEGVRVAGGADDGSAEAGTVDGSTVAAGVS